MPVTIFIYMRRREGVKLMISDKNRELIIIKEKNQQKLQNSVLLKDHILLIHLSEQGSNTKMLFIYAFKITQCKNPSIIFH